MSDLIVPLTTVDEVSAHPNAERLDIVKIKGWQTIVAKGSMKAGDLVVYVPPDAMVPDEWATRWGVKDYLGKDGRVRAVRLRGEPSYGFAVPVAKCEDMFTDTPHAKWGGIAVNGGEELEKNVAEVFGITKYLPPPPKQQRFGILEPGYDGRRAEHPAFSRYTEIENMRHWPTLLEGMEVVITEKIHGTNSRVGVVDGERMAGSHRVQRKHPDDIREHAWEQRQFHVCQHVDAWYQAMPGWKRWLHSTFGLFTPPRLAEVVNSNNPGTTVYWMPFELDSVATMLEALGTVYKSVILYGEIYGPSIQKMGYGVPQGEYEYAAFDLSLDGQYASFAQFASLCDAFGVPRVPELWHGTFDLDVVKAYSEGPTTINGGPHHREGVVVKPINEARHPDLGTRLIQKYVGDQYLTDKHGNAEDISNDIAEESMMETTDAIAAN